MLRTLYLIRAMAFDEVAQCLAANLSAALTGPVTFVCDETRGPVDTGPYPKVPLTKERLAELGLAPLPDGWGWLCGDMCYYAAAAAFPDYDRYVLIESDVFLSPEAAAQFVTTLARRDEEVIAAQLSRHADPKRYSRGLTRLGGDPRDGCIFPVSCASARAVALMKDLRLRAIAECPDARINDEAILASTAIGQDLPHAPLEVILPAMFGPETYATNPPHLFDAQRDNPDPARAFHPIVTYATVMARVQSGEKNYHKHRLRRILAEATRPQRQAIKAALQENEA